MGIGDRLFFNKQIKNECMDKTNSERVMALARKIQRLADKDREAGRTATCVALARMLVMGAIATGSRLEDLMAIDFELIATLAKESMKQLTGGKA